MTLFTGQDAPAVIPVAAGADGSATEGRGRPDVAGPDATQTPAGATADGGVETTGDVGVAPAGAPFVFVVHGLPAPQGSKSAFRNQHTGRIQQVESSKRVKPWRQDVVAAACDARDDWRAGWLNDHWQPFDGPLAVRMVFTFTRPRSHYRTGRNAHLLKADAPVQPCSTPDLDKLARSTCDALVTAGLIADDARIAEYDRLAKVWANEDREALAATGARIEIRRVTHA
jgi:Holliday junction resolvase RusA-like endonuclease